MPVDTFAFDKDRLNTVDSVPATVSSLTSKEVKGWREALCRDALQVGAVKPGGSEIGPRGGLRPTQFLWQLRGQEAVKRLYS